MPYYDYECKECGKQFEAQQSFEEHDRHVDHDKHQKLNCPKCGSRKVEQRLGSAAYAVTAKKS